MTPSLDDLQSRLSSLLCNDLVWKEKSAISPSFDQRSSSAKSALADVRSLIKVEQENSTSIELYYEGSRLGSS